MSIACPARPRALYPTLALLLGLTCVVHAKESNPAAASSAPANATRNPSHCVDGSPASVRDRFGCGPTRSAGASILIHRHDLALVDRGPDGLPAGSDVGASAQQQAPVGAGARLPIAAMILDAVRQADAPPAPETLRQVCATQVNVGGLSPVITFVASTDGPVVLATLTEYPLADVRRDIAIKTDLRLPWPPSGTIDWAYVYDHDSDGVFDHIAYFIGPMAMEPANPPGNLPSIAGPDPYQGPAVAAFVRRYVRDGFWQGFDTDRDGNVDTLAYPATNKANGWMRGWAVITGLPSPERCEMLDPDGRVVEPCAETSGSAGDVEDEHGGYESRTASAHRYALRPDLVWESIQQGARACRLKAEDYRH